MMMRSRKSAALKYKEDVDFADECRPECTIAAAANAQTHVDELRRAVMLYGLQSRESNEGQPVRREKGPKPNEDRVKIEGLFYAAGRVPVTSMLINDGHDGTIACELCTTISTRHSSNSLPRAGAM